MTATSAHENILQFSDFNGRGGRRTDPGAQGAAVTCREKLFVQVILCGSRPELVGRTWSCRTLDAAVESLTFQCDQELPEDALVDVWVDLASEPGKFFLSGRVERCAAQPRTGYRISVCLEDGAATDIDSWRRLMG